MDLTIDHAVFGWSDHRAITDLTREVGLDPTYGGEHADGATEMSVVPFPDGSYLEFIAPTGEGTPGYWPEALQNDAGPCAWAVRSDDLVDDLTDALHAGFPVEGPHDGGRQRPDGTLVEWSQGFVGEPPIPFAIQDRTPRQYRVPSTERSLVASVGTVVLGVADVEAATERFRRLVSLPTPRIEETPLGEVSWFPGQPFALVEAPDRVVTFGPMPVAHLLRVRDFGTAQAQFALTAEETWFGNSVAWFDADPFEKRLGVVG
ncbi:VOC family protein [Natronomonas sp. EA1]|uniref:VOC family protein n=1 Tax=Natronomonas sp. EA1 TaxID=3421655 RepID=UPI003EC15362